MRETAKVNTPQKAGSEHSKQTLYRFSHYNYCCSCYFLFICIKEQGGGEIQRWTSHGTISLHSMMSSGSSYTVVVLLRQIFLQDRMSAGQMYILWPFVFLNLSMSVYIKPSVVMWMYQSIKCAVMGWKLAALRHTSCPAHLPVGFIDRGVGATAQFLCEQKVRELRRGKARGHVTPARDIKHFLKGNK